MAGEVSPPEVTAIAEVSAIAATCPRRSVRREEERIESYQSKSKIRASLMHNTFVGIAQVLHQQEMVLAIACTTHSTLSMNDWLNMQVARPIFG